MDKPVICLLHTGGERAWVEGCVMRLQTSASVLCHELRREDPYQQLDHRFDLEGKARLILVILSDTLLQDTVFVNAEWPALLERHASGQAHLLPIWSIEPDDDLLPGLDRVAAFTFFGHGLRAAEQDEKCRELAFQQLVVKVNHLLAQPLSLPAREQLVETLFLDFYESLFAFFRHRCSDRDLARELVQETYLRLASSAGAYRGEAHPRRWLKVLATNVWRNFLRNRKASKRDGAEQSLEQHLEGQAEPFESLWAKTPLSPEDQLLESETHRLLEEAVDTLPHRMNQVVVLRLEGLKYEEIAERLGMSIQTVKSHLNQAKARLEPKLGVKN